MNSSSNKEQELLEKLGSFDAWMDKYNYIIELGRMLPDLNNEHRTKEKLIRGCQSQVWLHAEIFNGKVIYSADSDSIITKGIIAIIIMLMSNKSPREIVETDLSFLNDIGIKEFLSPTRSNGLLEMIGQVKHYAESFNSA